jgi:hypothetical protein
MNAQLGGRQARPDDVAADIEHFAVGDCALLNGVEVLVDRGPSAGMTAGWADMSQPAAVLERSRNEDQPNHVTQ